MSVTLDGIEFSITDFASTADPAAHTQLEDSVVGALSGETYPPETRFPERIFRAMVNHINYFTNIISTAQTNVATMMATVQGYLTAVQAFLSNTTSSSSVAISSGTKTFVVAASHQFAVGMYLTIVRTSDPTASRIYCQVLSWNPGTLTLQVTPLQITGSGTFNNWTIAISGARGPTGAAGTLDIDSLDVYTKVGTNDKLVFYNTSLVENDGIQFSDLQNQIATHAMNMAAISGV